MIGHRQSGDRKLVLSCSVFDERAMDDHDAELEISQPGKSRTPLPLQNSYAAKKTVVQGLMDVALVMANANQLRFVIEYSYDTRTYYAVFSLLVASLVLQVHLDSSGGLRHTNK